MELLLWFISVGSLHFESAKWLCGSVGHSTSSLSSSGDATANIKGETDQELVTECTIRQWNGLLPIWL